MKRVLIFFVAAFLPTTVHAADIDLRGDLDTEKLTIFLETDIDYDGSDGVDNILTLIGLKVPLS